MALIHGELYDALLDAGVSPQLASKAAEVGRPRPSALRMVLSSMNPIIVLLVVNLILTMVVLVKIYS